MDKKRLTELGYKEDQELLADVIEDKKYHGDSKDLSLLSNNYRNVNGDLDVNKFTDDIIKQTLNVFVKQGLIKHMPQGVTSGPVAAAEAEAKTEEKKSPEKTGFWNDAGDGKIYTHVKVDLAGLKQEVKAVNGLLKDAVTEDKPLELSCLKPKEMLIDISDKKFWELKEDKSIFKLAEYKKELTKLVSEEDKEKLILNEPAKSFFKSDEQRNVFKFTVEAEAKVKLGFQPDISKPEDRELLENTKTERNIKTAYTVMTDTQAAEKALLYMAHDEMCKTASLVEERNKGYRASRPQENNESKDIKKGDNMSERIKKPVDNDTTKIIHNEVSTALAKAALTNNGISNGVIGEIHVSGLSGNESELENIKGVIDKHFSTLGKKFYDAPKEFADRLGISYEIGDEGLKVKFKHEMGKTPKAILGERLKAYKKPQDMPSYTSNYEGPPKHFKRFDNFKDNPGVADDSNPKFDLKKYIEDDHKSNYDPHDNHGPEKPRGR